MVERGRFGAGDIIAVNRGEDVIDVHVRWYLFCAASSPRRVVHGIGVMGCGGDAGGMELKRRRSGIDKGPGRSGIVALGVNQVYCTVLLLVVLQLNCMIRSLGSNKGNYLLPPITPILPH